MKKKIDEKRILEIFKEMVKDKSIYLIKREYFIGDEKENLEDICKNILKNYDLDHIREVIKKVPVLKDYLHRTDFIVYPTMTNEEIELFVIVQIIILFKISRTNLEDIMIKPDNVLIEDTIDINLVYTMAVINNKSILKEPLIINKNLFFRITEKLSKDNNWTMKEAFEYLKTLLEYDTEYYFGLDLREDPEKMNAFLEKVKDIESEFFEEGSVIGDVYSLFSKIGTNFSVYGLIELFNLEEYIDNITEISNLITKDKLDTYKKLKINYNTGIIFGNSLCRKESIKYHLKTSPNPIYMIIMKKIKNENLGTVINNYIEIILNDGKIGNTLEDYELLFREITYIYINKVSGFYINDIFKVYKEYFRKNKINLDEIFTSKGEYRRIISEYFSEFLSERALLEYKIK